MSRLVAARPRRTLDGATLKSGEGDQLNEKLERVAKYIPGEIVAAYIFFNGLINAEHSHGMRTTYFSVTFVFCLIMTPIYLGRVAEAGDPKRYQQVVSSIAFILWAYALGVGIFVELGIYLPILAGLLLGMFSVVSAYSVPSKD